MAKGQRLKPEKIVTLLRQIDVLTSNGKTLAQACKEVGTVEQSYYRWRKIFGGMQVDQAKRYAVSVVLTSPRWVPFVRKPPKDPAHTEPSPSTAHIAKKSKRSCNPRKKTAAECNLFM